MTADPQQSFQVDPTHAASVIASIFAAMGSPGPTNPSSTTPSPTGVPPTNTPTTDLTGGLPPITAATSPATPIPTVSSAPTSTSTGTQVGQLGQSSSPTAGSFPVVQAFGVNGEGGVDLGSPAGTPVLAMFQGKVEFAGPDAGFGHMVIINHGNGIRTVYGHLQGDFKVHVGDDVQAGQQLDTVGQGIQGQSTGPHLEVQVQVNGQKVDPTPYLAGASPVVGTPSASSATGTATAPTPMDPNQILSNQVSNVVEAMAGQTPSHTDTTTTAPTTASATASGATTGADNDPNALPAFLAATRQHESGGNYQSKYQGPVASDASGAYGFLSSTYRAYGGTTAQAYQASPAEQDQVASNMAMQLFNQFHSWRLVAIAWYGGPGIAQQVASGQDPGSPAGQPSYLSYGDWIASHMAGNS